MPIYIWIFYAPKVDATGEEKKNTSPKRGGINAQCIFRAPWIVDLFIGKIIYGEKLKNRLTNLSRFWYLAASTTPLLSLSNAWRKNPRGPSSVKILSVVERNNSKLKGRYSFLSPEWKISKGMAFPAYPSSRTLFEVNHYDIEDSIIMIPEDFLITTTSLSIASGMRFNRRKQMSFLPFNHKLYLCTVSAKWKTEGENILRDQIRSDIFRERFWERIYFVKGLKIHSIVPIEKALENTSVLFKKKKKNKTKGWQVRNASKE